MKIIKLNESQFFKLLETNKIFESNGNGAPNFSNGDLKEYPSSEVTTTSNVTNPEGELEYGKPTDTDKLQDTLSIQNFWANGRRGTRAM